MIAGGSRESERGRIILIGSMTAHMSNQGDAAYAALKAGDRIEIYRGIIADPETVPRKDMADD